jgi:transposase, IS5 family
MPIKMPPARKAVDAWLASGLEEQPPARKVESASKPLSNDEIRKEREKKETPDGKVDKNGNALKFSRDLESDWTVKNDKPHYGLKEHASVDVENGFI